MQHLIFDIGFHKGEDTAYYLQKGYQVVAVEAYPILAEQGRKVFAKAIGRGQLTLLNIGIAENIGILPFYCNKTQLLWSSFDKEQGTKNQSEYEVVDVPTTTLQSLIQEYGKPYLIKIDIEGYDIFCIWHLPQTQEACPPFVVCEASTVEILEELKARGYSKYKLINQGNGFYPINLRKEKTWWYPYWVKVRNGLNKHFGKLLGFKYVFGAVGPFAEESKGEWQTYDQVKNDYLSFMNNGKPLNPVRWFDFHATF